MKEHRYSLGIDIGGTGTEYGVVNEEGKVIYENDVLTTDFADPAELVAFIYNDKEVQSFMDSIIGIG
ncbi:MAG: ROK family protein, partial [Bacteroidota bacterium]